MPRSQIPCPLLRPCTDRLCQAQAKRRVTRAEDNALKRYLSRFPADFGNPGTTPEAGLY